jgi:molybdopterin converting factor small subunit
MSIVKIPAALRSYTDGQVEISVDASTVGEAVQELVERFSSLKPYLYDGDDKLRPFVNLFVEEHNVKDLDGLKTPLGEDSRVLLVPSISGG